MRNFKQEGSALCKGMRKGDNKCARILRKNHHGRSNGYPMPAGSQSVPLMLHVRLAVRAYSEPARTFSLFSRQVLFSKLLLLFCEFVILVCYFGIVL